VKKEDDTKAGDVKNELDGNNPIESARKLTVTDKRVHATYKGKMLVNEKGMPVALDGPSILYGVNHRLVSFFSK
jgi:hypothetical protein